ncbi:hypothetical protein Drorol1_Dr00018846 [Drosera rotundifolia]
MVEGMKISSIVLFMLLCAATYVENASAHWVQPLSKIVIQKATVALDEKAYVRANPTLLGLKVQNRETVTVQFSSPNPSPDDWIGVFSPANFSAASCNASDPKVLPPLIRTAPIKFQYANFSSAYARTGNGKLRLLLINQRSDFSFALFTGGLSNPKLVAVSNTVAFVNPKAPVYPRIAQGKSWNEMAIKWTSGYGIDEAVPFVEWGLRGGVTTRSPAGTVSYTSRTVCGAPARTVGWRDPGYIHVCSLKELWPNLVYVYRLGHKLSNGTYVYSEFYSFKASPYPGQNSLQRVVIFGDMGKGELDGSNEYNNYQQGALNTTMQLMNDLENIDIVFHIGNIVYANGYLSQWDQFTAQVEPIASTVPYMTASGNHERDWPDTGSFYATLDSGGECGVPLHYTFYVPAENTAKRWYSTDYGMFKFCIADTEQDWREGSDQYKFIEQCFATADRSKQPWLIFLAHRVLGYSSGSFYALEGSFGEPMGRAGLQKLWQKYRVDIAIYGHVHNYERTCPIYENICTMQEKQHYKGALNGTIHVVAGGGGSSLAKFSTLQPNWSIFRDYDYGFVKLTAFNQTDMLFEYKRSSDGKVHDSFTISRDYQDILSCTIDSCPGIALAS